MDDGKYTGQDGRRHAHLHATVTAAHILRMRRLRLLAFVLPGLLSCSEGRGRTHDSGTLVVYNAGSLARPMRAVLDSFAVKTGVTVHQESAGSLESARKLTELGKIPDVIALADYEVFPKFLMPEHVSWYVLFARNRMVLAHLPGSARAAGIDSTNWWTVLAREGVRVGRADPNLDPNGYRTLLSLRLAELESGEPGLAARLLRQWGDRYIRPKEADLLALLQAGEVDFIWSYESMAQAAGLAAVRLGSAVDLGSPSDSARYARATVTVAGRARGDSVTFTGAPIAYALSIPRDAPHPRLARAFAQYLMSTEGRRILRSTGLDAIDLSPRVDTVVAREPAP